MMLLMQDLRNVVLQTSKLLVDVMQELIQVCSLKLTALDQNLLGENKNVRGLKRQSSSTHHMETNLLSEHCPLVSAHTQLL